MTTGLSLLRRAEAEREAFWADFVRRPSPRGPPGRQFVQRPADPHPYWVTRSTDPEQAESLSLCVYLGAREFDNAVEIPAVCVRIPLPELLADRPLELLEAANERCGHLGLPDPHYTLFSPETEELWLMWRIRPLHRPSQGSAPACHAAWRKMRFAWRMCQLKLALAFAELGALPTPDIYEPMLPLPHEATRGALLKLGSSYLIDAQPDLPTLLVQDVSGPLDGRYDKAAFKVLRPLHERAAPWSAKGAWLESDAFVAANAPKPPGYRHPAALTQACILRWAGFTRAEILRHLRQWLVTCPSVEGFLDRELQMIADWADRILVPGGPRKASARGRYQRKREVIAALLLTLEAEGADAQPLEATQAELCQRATLHTGVPVSKSTVQKLLVELEREGHLRRLVFRRGRASFTAWQLGQLPAWAQATATEAAANANTECPPWRPPELPPTGQPSLMQAGADLDLTEGRVSKREKNMGLGASFSCSEPGLQKPQKPDFLTHQRSTESGPESPPNPAQKPADPPGLSPQPPGPDREIPDKPPGSPTDGPRAPGSSAPLRLNPDLPAGIDPDPGLSSMLRRPTELPAWPAEGDAALRARLRDAEVLSGLAFSLIPLRPQSKRPVAGRWKMAQVAAASFEALARDLARHPGANLAVVTGAVSSVVVVDLDNDASVRWAQAHLPPTPLVVSTARGEHWYYRLEGGCRSFNPMRHDPTLAINVKGDGGYVVAPGSTHPSGDRYMPTTTWTAELVAAAPRFSRSWFPPDPAAPPPAEADEDALSPRPDESEHAFGQRIFREMNRAMRRGDTKRLRELAALLKKRR